MPSWSSSERKARHMSLSTSVSYHSLMRRQHVEGLGYREGRSLHLAPVLRTQRIPSNTSRSSARGRPPLGPTGFLGIRGSIFRHCASVKYTTRLLTGIPSGESKYTKSIQSTRGYFARDLARLQAK
jgi:hypothetical protein